jgi:hypothetical protein
MSEPFQPDPNEARKIIRAAGVDPDRMEEVMAPFAELGAVRGPMAAAEMLKAAGVEFADAWLESLLDTYREAFGRSHAADKRT